MRSAVIFVAIFAAGCAGTPHAPEDAPAGIACDQHGHCVPLDDDDLDNLQPAPQPLPGVNGLIET